ncbi:glutamine-hydrolyzing GMP synthase [Odoribacter lunatus]|uniref:glutamine-hydrolyzing GMP synthase n=1 Tax=Odoribacter lunatus TaxID=2941335 RepID=UPI00203F4BBD|nr:glutamine-hydrolyzing GMP synthase [Odoribacter lunatus]
MQEKILILDFGSQYTQLIARRVRELNVYCEIYPYNHYPVLDSSVKGVILSGSPFSVRDEKAPQPDLSAIKGKLPLLGVCFGAQYLAHHFGGEVKASNKREYGRANLTYIDRQSLLFDGIGENTQVWMSHGDTIEKLPAGYRIIASTADVKNAAFKVENETTYGIQFHPEVYHSTEGAHLLRNFVVNICGCKQKWTPDSFVETTVTELKQKLGDDRVILGLSGGVDSTVAAMLLHRAIGNKLTCIFVDNGLLRKDEYKNVLENYKELGLNVVGSESGDLFLSRLAGVTEPEKKRKIIGSTFIDVFDQEASKIKDAKWLGQGTIYPDVIESLSVNGPSQTIKSHHNVGGLPDYMKLKLVEPLRLLFKDEVRRVGKSLGLADKFLQRHPFPGPGLAIRILGEITPEKVRLLQEADHIFISMLQEEGLYNQVWQAGVMLLPVQSVGVMGDERTYESVVALRAVESTDGMTADWCHLPYEFLARVSNRIINNVRGINRVVYDISSKPPATIEWE